ncbi:hypothetical protein E4L95_17870, partial [Paracoccus liaowanqingii]
MIRAHPGPQPLDGAGILRPASGRPRPTGALAAMILLANPNSTTATTRAMCAILAPVLPHLRGWTAPEGPGVIETPAQLDAAGRLVAALTPPPGCRGVIVAAFGDPG